MASPQTEEGYTQIANELLDNIPLFKFNGSQFSIILTIIRNTYGYHRKYHEMSLSFITSATGMNKKQVDRELKELIVKNVVSVGRESVKNAPRRIGINKNYDLWDVEKREKGILQSEDTVSSNQRTPSDERYPLIRLPIKKERSLKKIIKESSDIDMALIKTESIIAIYEHWQSSKLIKHRSLTEQMKRQIKSALNSYSQVELIRCITNYSTIYLDNEYVLDTAWSLHDFFEKGHYEKFSDERNPFKFYPKVNGGKTKQKQSESNKEALQRRMREVNGYAAERGFIDLGSDKPRISERTDSR